MATLSYDVRHALRALLRRPGYTGLAVVALALGIGANTTVFSIANWVLLRPVPGVHAQEELATIRFTSPDDDAGNYAVFTTSNPVYEGMRRASTSFDDLAAYIGMPVHLATDGESRPVRSSAQMVTANFFDVLGVEMVEGRGFTEAEGELGADPATVISHRLWRERLGSEEIVGSSLRVNGHDFRVVGVAPPGFLGPELPGDADLWIPSGQHRIVAPQYAEDVLADERGGIWFHFVGRLADGTSLEVARDEVASVAASLSRSVREGRMLARVIPGIGSFQWARRRAVRTVQIMLAVVAFVMLLACANVTNLTLARASGRGPEIAIRRALGAGRLRLVVHLLVESILLALAGGVAAVVASLWMLDLFAASRLVSWMPSLGRVGLDWRVLGTTLAISVVAGVAFGILPALRASRAGAIEWVRGPSGSHGRTRLRDGVVVSQLALALALVAGAMLLFQTIAALRNRDLGVDREVVTFSVDPGLQGYTDARIASIYEEILSRLETLPEVESASLAWPPPVGRRRDTRFIAAWGEDPHGEERSQVSYTQVSPEFFTTMRIPLKSGEIFDSWRLYAGEDDPAVRRVVVSESLARRLFPDGPAVGRQLAQGTYRTTDDGLVGDQIALEIVGVVGDFQRPDDLVGGSGEAIYKALGASTVGCPSCGASFFPRDIGVQLRAGSSSADLASRVREALATVDDSMPAFDLGTVGDKVDEAIADYLLLGRLTGALAALALVLAAIGIYGVVTASVRMRFRELGVRIAVGADARSVLRLILARSGLLAGLGVAAGSVLTLGLVRLIASRLYGVAPLSAVTAATAAFVLAATALLASLVPALRATRVDPVEVLRAD